MATVTTIFRPDPTCYASSNLWLNLNREPGGCDTYYPPFAPRPTEIISGLDCAYAQLGRPLGGDADQLCHQSNPVTTGNTIYTDTAYSACPEGMTGAKTDTTARDGIIFVNTVCCPSAYDFTPAGLSPTPIPSVINGTTYPVTLSTSQAVCKAASITALSDQTVTLTVSDDGATTTTEVSWDYENGVIFADPAVVYKRLYPDPVAGTTSTCFGEHKGCKVATNPLIPQPTRDPESSPPWQSVGQFTPGLSCFADPSLWLVSGHCTLATTRSDDILSPPWLQCTHTAVGEPDESHTDCYQGGPSRVHNETATFFTVCPVAYTPAAETTSKPFDESASGTATKTYDVVAVTVACCPIQLSAPFRAAATADWESTTVHDGETYTVQQAPLPRCVATAVTELSSSETVTMGLYGDPRRLGETNQGLGQKYPGTTEVAWAEGEDRVYAHHMDMVWTVFDDLYTCFENCDEYFTYAYRDSQRDTASPSTTSTGAAAVMARVDVQGGLSVVVVVVTVFHVVVGALV